MSSVPGLAQPGPAQHGPGRPDQPGRPSQPGLPSQPGQPSQPGYPAQPGYGQAGPQQPGPALRGTVPPALVGCVPAAPGRRTGSAVLEGLASGLPAACASVSLQVGLLKDLPALVVLGGALALAWLTGFVVVAISFSRTGASPGKKALGLRLVDERTGGAPGAAAWGRFVLAGLGGAVLVGWIVAVVAILSNPRGDRRTWYDRATHLVLLDVVAGRDPLVGASPAAQGWAGGTSPQRADAPDAPGLPGAGGSDGLGAIAGGQHGTQFGQQSVGGLAPADQPLAAVPILVALDGTPLHPGSGARATRVAPSAERPPVPAAPVAPPAPPAPPAAPATPPPARAIFTFDTGQEHEVSGSGIVGRAPRGTRAGGPGVHQAGAPEPAQPEGGDPDAATVTIEDSTRTVSKSHLSYVVETAGVRVTDRGSTNGSTVVGLDGARVPLVAGDAVLVPYGATVSVGEHSFTLTRVTSAQEDFADAGETVMRDPR